MHDHQQRPAPARIDPDQSKGWMARLLPVLRAHQKTIFTGIGTAVLALIPQVAIPRILMVGIDRGIVSHTIPLAPIVAILLVLGGCRFGLGYVSRLALLSAGFDVEYDLRAVIQQHVSGLSFSFYDRVQSGQLISRANSDVRAIQMFLTFAPNIAVQVFGALVAFVVMLTINVPLALVAMATMPLVYWTGAHMRKLLLPISWMVQARLAEVATLVEENVGGVRVVKSFAAEGQQVRAMARVARRVQWATVRQMDVQAHWAPVMQNLPSVGLAVVLLYGGWLVLHHQVTIGALLAFNAYVLMLQAPFRMLGMIMVQAQRAAASAARVFEVLDERPAIADRPGARDLVEPDGEVTFEDVTFAYGRGPTVLEHLTLTLHPGETVALVGRTGSGKSTVAKLLERFYDVQGGAVRIDGQDVRDLTQVSLHKHLGMVLDEPFLFSTTIRDNIAYGRPDAELEDVIAAAKAARAHDFITALPEGYATVVGERGYTLSGGQRQRIALARTLLLNPRILILDDATSAIDVQVELAIHAALRALLAHRTTLVIAHRLSTIRLADRVVLLDRGRVIAEGTHAELMATEPRYVEVLAQITADNDGDLQTNLGEGDHLHGLDASRWDARRGDGRTGGVKLAEPLKGAS